MKLTRVLHDDEADEHAADYRCDGGGDEADKHAADYRCTQRTG